MAQALLATLMVFRYIKIIENNMLLPFCCPATRIMKNLQQTAPSPKVHMNCMLLDTDATLRKDAANYTSTVGCINF